MNTNGGLSSFWGEMVWGRAGVDISLWISGF